MKLVSLLFKHVVGNQASITAYPILLPAPRGMATVCWNEFYPDVKLFSGFSGFFQGLRKVFQGAVAWKTENVVVSANFYRL